MALQTSFDSPITDDQEKRFRDWAIGDFGGADVNIEEVTHQTRIDVAVGDRANAAGSPFEFKVLERASSLADKTSINCRTQDPLLDGGARLPGDMAICIFGVGLRVVTAFEGAAPTPIIQGVIARGVDDMILVCKQGALRKFELAGDEIASLGSGQQRNGVAADVDETNYGVKDRGWRKIKPVIFGKDQQLTLSLYTSRIADWGAAFSMRLMMQCLIARVK